MPVAPIVLGGLAAAQGIYQMSQGAKDKRAGERAQAEAMQRLEETDIADYNRPAMNQMLMRSRQGMPEASMTYAERGAERAAGAALGAMEDRRAGLTGIGQAQQSLSDTYSQLASMDAQQRLASEQAYIAAQQEQAAMQYQQALDMGNTELALARGQRLEGIEAQNAGMQNVFQGASLAAYGFTPNLGSPLDDAATNAGADAAAGQAQSFTTFNPNQIGQTSSPMQYNTYGGLQNPFSQNKGFMSYGGTSASSGAPAFSPSFNNPFSTGLSLSSGIAGGIQGTYRLK